MSPVPVSLAVEDILAEEALRRILAQTNRDFTVRLSISHNGNAKLKARAPEYNRSAAGFPLIILTDQDTAANCPPQIIADWFDGHALHANLLFRVAVMETESWLLADRACLSGFLSTPLNKLPQDTDQIPNPKQFIVNLARSSQKSSIRDALIPREGSTATVGRDYNGTLTDFIKNHWDPTRARAHSPSLNRAFNRLIAFLPNPPA